MDRKIGTRHRVGVGYQNGYRLAGSSDVKMGTNYFIHIVQEKLEEGELRLFIQRLDKPMDTSPKFQVEPSFTRVKLHNFMAYNVQKRSSR